MTRAVALLASLSLLGCFPHNPKARTYAQLGEGAAILAGIGISAFANTTADCDLMSMPGIDDAGCRSGSKWLSTAGVVLIVGGLLGFVATVSTAEEAAKSKPVETKDMTKPAPPGATTKLPSTNPGSSDAASTSGTSATGSTEGSTSGSAANPSAPPR